MTPGDPATEAAIDAGQYPLVRPFLFVTRGPPTGAAREFMDWLLSSDGRALIRKEGLLPPGK